MSRAPSAARRGLVGLGALVALVGGAGCPADESNPDVLWLDMYIDELHVRLVDAEPLPF